jgi:hypothetical protein
VKRTYCEPRTNHVHWFLNPGAQGIGLANPAF